MGAGFSLNSNAKILDHWPLFCERVLSFKNAFRDPVTSFDTSDWKREWRLAEEREDIDAGAFILAHQMLVHVSDLRLSFFHKNGLRAFSKSLTKSYLRVDPLGNDYTDTQRLVQFTKWFLKNYVWSLGPFVFRRLSSYEERLGFSHLSKKMRAEWRTNLPERPDFFERVGLPYSRFSEQVFGAVFLESNANRNIWFSQRGRLFQPTLFIPLSALLSILTTVPLSPEKFLDEGWAANYTSTEFLEDLQKDSGKSLKNSDITFITDVNILSDSMNLEESGAGRLSKSILGKAGVLDPSNISFIQDTRAHAKSFQLKIVDSITSFNAAIKEAHDSDFVFINFHGRPGVIAIGGAGIGTDFESGYDNLRFIEETTLKPGATLVFFSCAFGEKQSKDESDEAEAWTRLSRKFLKTGMAIASVNDISFDGLLVAPPEKQTSQAMSWTQTAAQVGAMYIVFGEKLLKQAFLSPWIYHADLEHYVERAPPVLLKKSPSLRIFHPETGKIEQYTHAP